MNIAYLDPPYSGYFQRLGAHLARLTGGSTLALLSCPAYRMYVGRDRCLVWQPGTTSQRHAVPQPFERAEWAALSDEAFLNAFSHAVEWFKTCFRAERIDACLVFSDARPFSAAARVAAQELGVVCLFFERGAFRLRTSSLSTQGINARFDLRVAERCGQVAGMQEADLPPRRHTEPWLRTRFAVFLFLNALSRAVSPVRGLMQHKRYHVFNYLRIAIKQFAAEHPELPVMHEPEPPQGRAPLVVLPLQLPTDSQFVMYSPFKHNQELIDFVARETRKALPEAQVLVKMHPMDVRRYRMPAGAQLIDSRLARFYDRRSLFVCLNSNAGFEAAIHGRPVLCFADSFYTNHPSVTRVNREEFAARLVAAAEAVGDPALGQDLRASVLRYCQAPGDAWAYTDEDLQRTAGVAAQHVQAAQRRHAAAARTARAPSTKEDLPPTGARLPAVEVSV
jgi:capsular polysaccharide export protein